jgi:multidrug efflux system membrane fusion protein
MPTHTAAALLLASALVLTACNADTKADAASTPNTTDSTGGATSNTDAVPVTIAEVSVDAIAQQVAATGTFAPRDEIPLSFKIGGVVARVLVDQGTAVRQGQLLAALDLREIDAMVDKARIGVEKAERDAARVARLVVDSVATLAQSQDATSALEAARADLATARVNREYATIVAPQAGIIEQRISTAGATIGAGMPVFMLGGSARGRVLRAGVPDRDALRLRVGDAATVTFDAVRGVTYPAAVTLLGKSADARTGTYTVEVQLRDTRGIATSRTNDGSAPTIASLPSGLVGRVTITTRATTTGALIPVDALIEADADSAIVYTVSATAPYIAEAHRVRITQVVGDKAAVLGLETTARVITRGAPYLTAGTRVRIVTEPTNGKAAP